MRAALRRIAGLASADGLRQAPGRYAVRQRPRAAAGGAGGAGRPGRRLAQRLRRSARRLRRRLACRRSRCGNSGARRRSGPRVGDLRNGRQRHLAARQSGSPTVREKAEESLLEWLVLAEADGLHCKELAVEWRVEFPAGRRRRNRARPATLVNARSWQRRSAGRLIGGADGRAATHPRRRGIPAPRAARGRGVRRPWCTLAAPVVRALCGPQGRRRPAGLEATTTYDRPAPAGCWSTPACRLGAVKARRRPGPILLLDEVQDTAPAQWR